MQPPPPESDRRPGDEPALLGPSARPVFQLAQRVWSPVPVRRPLIVPELERLSWPERSAEVVRHSVLSVEYWLSPSGFLREWVRVSLWLAVILIVAAVLIVPPVTALLEGVRDWSGLLTATVDNISTVVATLPPIVLAIATAFLAVKLIKHYAGPRRPQRRHPYDQYE